MLSTEHPSSLPLPLQGFPPYWNISYAGERRLGLVMPISVPGAPSQDTVWTVACPVDVLEECGVSYEDVLKARSAEAAGQGSDFLQVSDKQGGSKEAPTTKTQRYYARAALHHFGPGSPAAAPEGLRGRVRAGFCGAHERH